MKTKWIAILLTLVLLLPLAAGCTDQISTEDCTDGACEVPTYDDDGNQVYAIVSPVGYCDVEQIEQAPRLDTLSGKTIALVGGSFNASVTHAELIRCIRENYEDVTIYSFDEVGAGGPYSVFGQSAKTVAFQNKLKELKVDAVISGNCGCGLCTTKESGSSIAAEYIGIPTVTVGAPTFVAQIHSTGVNRGVPVLRTAEYPGAFSSHSNSELVKNTRETVWPQVESALTKEITEAEIALYANAGRRPYDEIVYYGSYDEVQEFCLVNAWTDGLPVTPPTDERIREYLRFTPLEADEVLGVYPLAYRECTVYTVAVNAVMAGVPKEFMPICVAFTECLANGEWRRPLASTHGWSPYAWINGPVARQLGIDCGQGEISEEVNKALGRFIDLAMLNLGGYYVKENRMGTFGYLSPFVLAEDEEACVEAGWEPYHVSIGYGANDNVLTAASALAWGNNVTPATDDAEIIAALMAWDVTEKQQNGLGNTNPQVPRTVLITAPVAKDLAQTFETRDALEDRLITLARRPLWMRTFANYWANTGSKQSTRYSIDEYYRMLQQDPDEGAAYTDTPDWMRGFVEADQIETIATMKKGETVFLVTGDPDRNKFQTLPGGGTVSVQIRLPENWDELIAPMGYEPLETFTLNAEQTAEKTPHKTDEAPASGGIAAPTDLKNGTWRLVPSVDQVTDSSHIYVSSDGDVTYMSSQGVGPLDLTGRAAFKKLLRSLGFGCSFTVSAGRVTEIVFRPSSVSRKNVTDASALTDKDLSGITLKVAVNLTRSKEGGGVSASGSELILSGSITTFEIDLGGTPVLAPGASSGFLTLDRSRVTLSGSASAGSTAAIRVAASDGAYRVFTFTKETRGSVRIRYENPVK